MNRVWKVKPALTPEQQNQFPEINNVILQLLFNRGIDSQEKIDRFLNPDYGQDLYDPFLFEDMAKAVDRIFKAIEQKEKIYVYGDYDADGVTSSAVMMKTLKSYGADVDIYIPYREKEGYGINDDAARQLIEEKTKLVITVDCGISNAPQVDILNSGGVDVIVTDHHHGPEKLPNALAVINPNDGRSNYPFKGLTGCGVAFKVVQGLLKKQSEYKVTQLPDGFEKWLLDLVAIGTVADIQPVLEENRIFVKYGLVVFNKFQRIGLKTLFNSLGNRDDRVDEKIIGWQVSPRLNAAGRLNHASTAYELLITEDQDEATKIVGELTATNQERQQITDKIKNESLKYIGEVKDQKILFAVGDGWTTGIVGLVAGRICDNFHLPTLVISHYNGEIIGSARSIDSFNIIEAIEQCSDYLVKFGGHPQAAGFTVKDKDNLDKFIKHLTELAEKELKDKILLPELAIDAEITLEDVNWELFEGLEQFSPFGDSNPKPKFLAKGITVVDMKKLGKDDKHLRLMASHKSPSIKKIIGFGIGPWYDKLNKGDKIDIVFDVDVNQWNGNRELQIKIIDLKKQDD